MNIAKGFTLRGRNPDVLTCIANLSNDEVFTPPEFANQMLDTMEAAWAVDHNGANIWANRNVRFLDPFTKSGVFLREITQRLIHGLEDEIIDLQERVDHILTQQVFGIGTTLLTSMLARRSVYCSKLANGQHSVTNRFNSEAGNIWFERIEHTWSGKKCTYCGAPKALFNRQDDQETYAYAFIHSSDIKSRLSEMFGDNMQFDVIIGNPPYQMAGGAGGSSDSSIYHLFVEQALNLEPRYVSMVVPSRWMAGGRGMDTFRADMLSNHKLREIVDFPVSKDVFPGVEVKGGICYFLWDKSHNGQAKVTTFRGKERIGPVARKLDEFDVFVRDPRSVEVLHKVLEKSEPSITEILTGDTPFGIATNFSAFRQTKQPGDIALHLVHKGKRSIGYLDRSGIKKNAHLIDSWKVLVPKAGSDGGQKIPDVVLGKPLIVSPGSICTQTFIAFGLSSDTEATSLQSYYSTKFFRFLVSIRKITQDSLRGTYTWVPTQSWDHPWTDALLYKKYGLTQDQIDYIEAVIKPMNLGDAVDDE
tara:strand:- start:630 stop:2222 length:1593 start_codon:yes stop_codon:yes gene_type:complete